MKETIDDILVGYPMRRGKKWIVEFSKPDNGLIEKIRECWDTDKKKFRNSIFLKREGNMIWVYLEDLKICVGWEIGRGSVLFRKIINMAYRNPIFEGNEYGRDLRRKINNSFGCW